jgi:hypothetical protein
MVFVLFQEPKKVSNTKMLLYHNNMQYVHTSQKDGVVSLSGKRFGNKRLV